ncbi:MAG TPA: O-antigen ligase family protein [Vicinamibacterales bacterium]|nr:O-antigen ligase family protein [Vicinamibacterales bacterium]
MALLLAWMTFPGGGVYTWVWAPAACAVLALALFVQPRIARGEDVRLVDIMLVISGLAMATQLVPLPSSLLHAIDPHLRPLRAAVFLLSPAERTEALLLPISVVPGDTAAALGVFATAALLYWICRTICEEGGAGRIVRAIATIGLVASVAAIVQRVESEELLYGVWRPQDAGAKPYGPFVNRNHFATWIIMACPLVFGYLLARAPSKRPQRFSQRVAAALKQLGSMRIWLVAAVCVMTLAMLLSTSRSGLIGLIGALTVSTWLTSKRQESDVWRWSILQGALLVLVAISFANFDALVARVDETLLRSGPGRGRSAIWTDAKAVIDDFPITGTGAGTFGTAIAIYQTAEPGYAIGQAHNHYLQLLAEGGALVAVPAALAVGAFVLLFRSRLSQDRTPNYLMRAGAGAGLAGVFLQSFWETGLRMPANAMLCAVLAAIATHAPTKD